MRDGLDDAVAATTLQLTDTDNDGIPDTLDSSDDRASSNAAVHTGVDGIGPVNPWMLMLLATFISSSRRWRKAGLLAVLAMLPLLSNADTDLKDSEKEDSPFRFYIGAGIGQSLMAPETDGTIYTVDDDKDFGYKLYLGMDVNEYFSAELTLADLGTTTLQPAGEIDYQIISLDGLYYFYDQEENDHEGWATYLKAGIATIDNTARNVAYIKDNSVQLSFGLGAEYGWENGLAVRADLESFDEDAALLTVGLLYRFGTHDKKPRRKDSDADGVFDDQDQCPGTSKATAVDSSGCELDSDNDGVVDSKDQCPSSVPDAKVDASGCNLDKDGDGVLNQSDQCPDTVKGANVNAAGCAIFEAKIEGVNFKPGSAELTQDSKGILDQAALHC